MTRFLTALRQFAQDQKGSYAIEGVIMLPMLIWSIMASVVFVDAYRMQTLNLRATYVVSDAVSRRWDSVNEAYFDGLWHLHGLQVNYAHQTQLRMTVVQWSQDDNQYLMRWSVSTDEFAYPILDQAAIDLRTAKVPELADGDSLVLVETWMDYTPVFSVGLPSMVFSNYIFVSPRYAPQIDFDFDDSDVGSTI